MARFNTSSDSQGGGHGAAVVVNCVCIQVFVGCPNRRSVHFIYCLAERTAANGRIFDPQVPVKHFGGRGPALLDGLGGQPLHVVPVGGVLLLRSLPVVVAVIPLGCGDSCLLEVPLSGWHCQLVF